MDKKNNKGLSVFLFLFLVVFVVMPFISSCGKSGNVSASTLNIQYQIVNLNAGLGSVDLYIDFRKVNRNSYFYPTSSGYFYLTSIDTPLQIRPGTTLTPGTQAPSFNIFNLDQILKPNLRYTLFITGLSGADSSYLFTTDTSSLPGIGRGKIRFINASPGSTGLDLAANSYITPDFSNIPYKTVSKFVELPAGNYNFQIFPHGSATALQTPKNVTILDGRLYTFYCYGLAGHTDSLAFGTGAIANN